jgi:hypothetical protein
VSLKKKGSDTLLVKIRLILKPDVIKKEIAGISQDDYHIVFLAGVGDAWSMIWVHFRLNVS